MSYRTSIDPPPQNSLLYIWRFISCSQWPFLGIDISVSFYYFLFCHRSRLYRGPFLVHVLHCLCISHKDDTWATAYLLTLSNICLMHTSQYYSIFFFSSQSHCIVILCFLPKSMNHFLSSAVKLYVPSTCYRYDGPCGFLWLLILDSREENYFYLYYIHYYLI